MTAGARFQNIGWTDRVLRLFPPGLALLTLAADPDALLADGAIRAALNACGFQLLLYDDPIAFRYEYESRFRSRWDEGAAVPELIVAVRRETPDVLPFDLLQIGRQVSISLADLFPRLHPLALAALGRTALDGLDCAPQPAAPLGESASWDFILRHVLDLDTGTVHDDAALLRLLLRWHSRAEPAPAALTAHLARRLAEHERFAGWPLDVIVQDSAAFRAFLQERWPIYLAQSAPSGESQVRESQSPCPTRFAGPRLLPFGDAGVRPHVDTLFLDGALQPVSMPPAFRPAEGWAMIGVKQDPEADRGRRMEGLLCLIEKSVPEPDAHHAGWLLLARRWAELSVLVHATGEPVPEVMAGRLAEAQDRSDTCFLAWLLDRYAGLHNLPPVPPAMLHHVPRALAREMEEHDRRRVALVVLDGMALDQWLLLRAAIARQRPEFSFEETLVFAWIPTLTSVSRQALLAGRPPAALSGGLTSTDREPGHWTAFWESQGLRPAEVGCVKDVRLESDTQRLEDALDLPGLRAAAIVVNTVDRIMHGMRLGMAGMHNQVRQWAQEGHVARLLDLLLARGFEVYVTADHGNMEAIGIGRPAEGVLAEERGQRVRVYSDALLRAHTRARFSGTIEWPEFGLPAGFLPLLATGRSAFARVGERVVSHGGASLEEVVVPLVHVRRPAANAAPVAP